MKRMLSLQGSMAFEVLPAEQTSMDKAKKAKPYKKLDRVKGPGIVKSALLVTPNQAYVDLPVWMWLSYIRPMQVEDGCPLEPRIRWLHPIPFSRVPIPF